MTLLSTRPQAMAAVLDQEPDAPAVVTCPMCHTPTSLSRTDIDGGAGWRCVRCGQHWSATRLSTVAAYAASVVESGAISAEQVLLPRMVPTDQRSGKP